MYCPKCAAQNTDDAKYCRTCGLNISLVPMALTGNLSESRVKEAEPVDNPFGSMNRSSGKNDIGKPGKRSMAKAASMAETGSTNRSGRGKQKKEPSLESGITNIFMGIGFVFVALGALFFAPAGRIWWFWLLIPAFAMFGGGVAELVRLKVGSQFAPADDPAAGAMPPETRTIEMPSVRNTTEMRLPPPSVTEGTTRHLDAEGPRPYFDPLSRSADKV